MTKRRSTPKPKRDREMEEVKRLTTVTLSQAEHRERLKRDKEVLQEQLRRVLRERNALEKKRLPIDVRTEFRGVHMLVKDAHIICANDILTLSSQLRAVKQKLQ